MLHLSAIFLRFFTVSNLWSDLKRFIKSLIYIFDEFSNFKNWKKQIYYRACWLNKIINIYKYSTHLCPFGKRKFNLPVWTQERSFRLGELHLSYVKERTSLLNKPHRNVTISTPFSSHLIFCLGIKFTSPMWPPMSFILRFLTV